MSLARYLSKLGALLNSDGKVQQAALAANVAGNGPAFSAYSSISQSITAGSTTKAQINTEVFDTNNCFDKDTNYRFQPTVAGYYQIQGAVSFGVNNSTTGCAAVLYRNGNVHLWGAVAGNISMYPSAIVADLIYLNGSTDYVELYAFNGTGATATTIGQSAYSRFSGTLVRAA